MQNPGRFTTVQPIERFNAVLQRVAQQFPGRVIVISIADLVCPDGVCSQYQQGMLVRYDGEHFTGRYSKWLGPELVDRILAAAGR